MCLVASFCAAFPEPARPLSCVLAPVPFLSVVGCVAALRCVALESSAEHHILHVREMKEASNRRLLRHQQDTLMKRAKPGERLARHPVTQHGIFVCARCGKPGHAAGACGEESRPSTSAPDEEVAPDDEMATDEEVAPDDEMAPVGPVLPCWLCGNLPFALGIDVSNKVCMGLSRDSVRKRMDYTFCAECESESED